MTEITLNFSVHRGVFLSQNLSQQMSKYMITDDLDS